MNNNYMRKKLYECFSECYRYTHAIDVSSRKIMKFFSLQFWLRRSGLFVVSNGREPVQCWADALFLIERGSRTATRDTGLDA